MPQTDARLDRGGHFSFWMALLLELVSYFSVGKLSGSGARRELIEPSCNLQVITRAVMQFARSYARILLLTRCFDRFFISSSVGMKAAP